METTITFPKENPERTELGECTKCQVGNVVGIQISNDHVTGFTLERVENGGLECASAIVEENGDGAGVLVYHDDVLFAVPIEIAQGNAHRILLHAERAY